MLNSNEVEYLVVGGYAVNYYGYARATAGLDIWVATDLSNAEKVAGALKQFGFAQAGPALFLDPRKVIRMGVPPLRLEILTSISGVDFAHCFARRQSMEMDGVPVNLIRLEDLKENKRATGRLKDLLDLEQLG